MITNDKSTLVGRTLRLLNPAGSKERYFSADKWDNQWSHGYDLDTANEDARYGALVALVLRHAQNGPLLDVGCGDGLFEELYRRVDSAPIVAFDYSAVAVERARSRNVSDVEFLCADSRTFRPEKKFSVVILNESLYYVDDYLGMMKTLSGALTPGGVFAVSMHETAITRRIWNNLQTSYTLLHGVMLKNESTSGQWHIRLLLPPK